MTASADAPQPTAIDTAAHWDRIYTTKQPTSVSWYEQEPTRSLELILATGLPRDAPVLDVGGGLSNLAARLVALGFSDVSVADISRAALERARAQADAAGERITWIEADVRRHDFPRPYDLWHDRAVFHFMVNDQDRDAYLATLHHSLRPGGHLILATFGPDGPEQCSGLPTARYDARALAAALGSDYLPHAATLEVHETPSGAAQQFLYAHFQRRV